MAKISIIQKPTFTIDVEIPRVGDKPVKVSFTFNYLPREKLAELADSGLASAKEVREMLEKDPSAREVAAKVAENQVAQLKVMVAGWGFEEEFNDDNLRLLANSTAHVSEVIMAAFHGAYNKAREGN